MKISLNLKTCSNTVTAEPEGKVLWLFHVNRASNMLAPVAPLHDADLGNDCGDCEVFLASIALEHLLGEAHLGHFELCQSALAWMKRYGCRTAKLLRENGYNCSTYEPAKWSYYTQRKDIVTYARLPRNLLL